MFDPKVFVDFKLLTTNQDKQIFYKNTVDAGSFSSKTPNQKF